MPAVDHDDEARFLAGQALLDDHARAGVTHHVVDEHRIDCGMSVGRGAGDDHALAGGEAVRLDDDRRTLRIDVGVRFMRVGERGVARRRNAVAHHERLREILGALELRRGAGRAEDPQAVRPECIDDARSKWRLGTDDRQIHRFLACEGHKLRNRRHRNVDHARLPRGSRVARRHMHTRHPRTLRELPGERMLAAAAADDEDVH